MSKMNEKAIAKILESHEKWRKKSKEVHTDDTAKYHGMFVGTLGNSVNRY